jgi:hypothetical protein
MSAGERRFMKTNANSTATALEATDKDFERMTHKILRLSGRHEQCWVRKSGCVCPINPALPGRKPSPTTMPPFFGLLRKAVFYSKNCTKLQENHNFFNEYSRQNADAIAQSRPRTNHLLGKRRLFNCRSTRQLEEENSRQTNSA